MSDKRKNQDWRNWNPEDRPQFILSLEGKLKSLFLADPLGRFLDDFAGVCETPICNTVIPLTVLTYVGRSGSEPDTSPSEVPKPCLVKIPQRKKSG